MILYSIIPIESVFSKMDTNISNDIIEIEYEGEKVEVFLLSNNTYIVNRVISTSLKAYLNPKLMPGRIIEGNF